MCVGKCSGREGTLGKHSYTWEEERGSVYKPWEGYAVLVLEEGERPSRWVGVSEPSVFRGDQALMCYHLTHGPLASSDARNMARDVQNTFYEIVAEFGNMSQAQAVDYVKKLMTKGRYSLDVWS